MGKNWKCIFAVLLIGSFCSFFGTNSVAADRGLDVLVGIIEQAARTDKEMDLDKYFDDSLLKAFNKSMDSSEGGPDFPWWFPRESYKTYQSRIVTRSDSDVSLIIYRDQGDNEEEHTIEYILRKNRAIWKILDVRELPSKHDPPSTKISSLRKWLGLDE
jgi:hypothetical protein